MTTPWMASVGTRKILVMTGLAVLVAGTVTAGLFYQHYFALFLFGVWCAGEWLLWNLPGYRRMPRLGNRRPLSSIASVLTAFRRADAASESALARKIEALDLREDLSDDEKRSLARLKELAALRGLVFGRAARGRLRLRQAFAYARESENLGDAHVVEAALQDITESATIVADLYWKLYETCLGSRPDLTPFARSLFAEIFQVDFEEEKARIVIERLMDAMQRDGGVPFLVLNLLRKGEVDWAREVTRRLLTQEVEIDEELRSGLYWIAELTWFTNEKDMVVGSFDATIRYLYHLCFTNPERAGFLEVDSRFFSQFETVSELAREGFLFKESLFEKALYLWKDYEGLFENIFCEFLEALTRRKSKIFHDRGNWELIWKRERENYCRDYLYVVEGNLSYAAGYFEDAREFYEKALKVNPLLRSAQLNLVFCLAKLGRRQAHQRLVEKVTQDTALLPSALYVAGDSYLLIGDETTADRYYARLRSYDGWDTKADYSKSIFCYENGLYEKAVEYARSAFEATPADSTVAYHLSLCYSALGQKDRALDVVKRVGDAPSGQRGWLNYYRFTLERDAGHHSEASETLLSIPREYFDDPEELEEAVEFAKSRKDLVLLRHLRSRD